MAASSPTLPCNPPPPQVMGDRILPHLGIIASALPHIWATASSHLSSPKSLSNNGSPVRVRPPGGSPSTSSDTGAVVRLHSALIAVLTHLVGKLRAVAVRDPQVAGVIFPLLSFSTSLGERPLRQGWFRAGSDLGLDTGVFLCVLIPPPPSSPLRFPGE